MTSTNRLLIEQIAIRLYEHDFGNKPDTPWDQLTRKTREIYRRRADNMAREVGVS